MARLFNYFLNVIIFLLFFLTVNLLCLYLLSAIDRLVNHHFLACDNYVWRIGNRRFPPGLQMERANDFFTLNYEFVDYLVNSDDDYLIYLKQFFKDNSVLSAEVYFK